MESSGVLAISVIQEASVWEEGVSETGGQDGCQKETLSQSPWLVQRMSDRPAEGPHPTHSFTEL